MIDRAGAVALTAASLLAVVALACAPSGPTPPATEAPGASAIPTASGEDPSEAPAGSEEPEDPPTPGASGDAIVVDAALLDILPTHVDDVAVEPDLETAAEVAEDPSLRGVVRTMAAAIAVGSSDVEDPDYVVASVVRLLAGVYDESFHRDWRDSFDLAVCEQAGGVDGHAEADIGGHATFITTCAGGVRTYHVHILDDAGDDILVSLQAFGERRFGERMVEGLSR